MDIPIWVYFVVSGIFVSAIMAVKASREEQRQENELIEKEGELYMKRLEKEKEARSGG